MEFRTGENEACTNIPIEDDDIFEGDEYFESFIEIPPNVDITPGRDLNVTISDNDRKKICIHAYKYTYSSIQIVIGVLYCYYLLCIWCVYNEKLYIFNAYVCMYVRIHLFSCACSTSDVPL